MTRRASRIRDYTASFSYKARRRIFLVWSFGKPIIASIAMVLTEQATIAAAVGFALVGVWSALETLTAESPRSLRERAERESQDLPHAEPTTDVTELDVVHTEPEAEDPKP
ncbi:MAG: hypothetical protein IPG45_05900 [Deltaproteobacteria bacterium]|nr:hypothetical protein [Deltaproteobacteria bacterium]